ncbi:MAG: EamA family transporter [Thermoleophilia bacterium]|nr:EamA family transporter [Thermoleophilia bacterium]
MATAPSTRIPATLLAFAAIVSLQFGSAFARTWFDEVGPLGAAELRLVFGSLLVIAFVRPRVRHWERRTWLGVLALGAALGGMNSCIYLAIDRIPFGVAVTVEFLGPLIVALAQARRFNDAFWALVAFAGVLLLGLEGRVAVSTAGLGFAGLAAICWAAYIVTSSRLARQVDGLSGLALAMSVAAVLVTPFGITDAMNAVTDDATVIPAFLVIAVLTSAVPYSLEFIALKRMPTRTFGVLSSLGPAVAALAGLAVLGQELGWKQLAAMAMVTAAGIGVSITRQSRRELPIPTAL